MDRIQNGWFMEVSDLWPGQAMCLEVDKLLHEEKSPYQDILVFKRCVAFGLTRALMRYHSILLL